MVVAERLGRLGTINRDGAEPEQTEAGFGNQFALFVGVEQRAVFELELTADAAGHQILKAVQQLDPRGRRPGIGQPRAADEAKPVAVEPAVTKGQREVLIDFLKDQFVAPETFVEVALESDKCPGHAPRTVPKDGSGPCFSTIRHAFCCR